MLVLVPTVVSKSTLHQCVVLEIMVLLQLDVTSGHSRNLMFVVQSSGVWSENIFNWKSER